ncbi:MAG: hypothetical protein JRF33_26325, partial [Deltaproteobacteria bacterium]|nr:hypothetical protein [Deltaproteobacteria bacterium]
MEYFGCEGFEQEYFSDGLAEELLNTLAGFGSLKVAARTSSFAFKGQQADIRHVGEVLGVAMVLEGSVRKSGNSLRITAQLIDASSGFHLWSATYDRELTETFAIQDDIAGKIMEALQVHLETGQTVLVSSTNSTQAYDHYLKGLQAMHRRTEESVKAAQLHYTAATTADPDYAVAWAGQALATYLLADKGYGDTPWEQAEALSRSLVERALALDPDLAEAHAVVALLLDDEFRYDEALASNALAIAAKPGFAEAYLWRSNTLRSIGRIREADEAIERAFQLDPLHPSIINVRRLRQCWFFAEPLSEGELEEMLANKKDVPPVVTLSCLARVGSYARAVELAQQNELDYMADLWDLINLKDCESPISGKLIEVKRIVRLVACRNDTKALND